MTQALITVIAIPCIVYYVNIGCVLIEYTSLTFQKKLNITETPMMAMGPVLAGQSQAEVSENKTQF